MKKIKIAVLFLFFTVFSYSQTKYPYIVEYNKLISKNKDSALSFSNRLIERGNIQEKAYVNALRFKYELADEFFQKSLEQLSKTNSRKTFELKASILHLKSLRYAESQELLKAIKTANDALKTCNDNCSFILERKLQATLGRAYSMANKHKEAIEISNISLAKIRKRHDFSTNDILKKEYVKELVRVASRTLNLYRSDKEEYKPYLDLSKDYIEQAEKYSKDFGIPDFDSYIWGIYAEVNFFKEIYDVAKEYYEKGLAVYEREKFVKKIEQSLFRIAECDYFLKNYDEAEATLLRQIESDVWSEYQLLANGWLSYFYLFKINEQKGNSKKALKYATEYAEKIEEHFKAKNASDLSVNDTVHLKNKEEEIQGYIDNYKKEKKEKRLYLYLSIALVFITILLIAYFIYARKRNKENISKLHMRIEELQNDISKQAISKTSSLSDESAMKLLKKLKELEKEELFQQPNYTLNLVAKRLQTNSSYLSKTVNQYMDISFAEYSNRLRINSIVQRLNEQKSLRNYTIDALAQEAGYKSVNSFNSNFKKILKVTPSQYLKEINKME